MRIGKKTIAFAIALAMSFAIGFSIASKTDAYAEGFTPTVSSDGSFRATGANKEVQVGVVTVNKNGKATVKKWDTYAVVPASGEAHGFFALTPKKDMYVAFRTVASGDGAYTSPVIWEIRKNPARYKASVVIDAANDLAKLVVEDDGNIYDGYVKVSANRGGSSPVRIEGERIIIDEGLYSTGATLQVTPEGGGLSQTKLSKVTYLGEEIAIAGAIKSDAKSINVKLKKRANAPKASIRYATGTATIRKDTSYRIIEQEGVSDAAWGDFVANSSKKEVELAGERGILEVIKPATNTSLASNIGVATYTKNDLDPSKVEVVSSEGLGVKITNYSDTDIDYQIGTSLKKEWKRIAKGGRASIPAKKLNISAGSKVFCRAAAIETECKIPGDAIEYDYLGSGNAYSYTSNSNIDIGIECVPCTMIFTNAPGNGEVFIRFWKKINGNWQNADVMGSVKLLKNGVVVDESIIYNGYHCCFTYLGPGTYDIEVDTVGGEYESLAKDKHILILDKTS